MMGGHQINPDDTAIVQLRLMDRLSSAVGDLCLICGMDKPAVIGVVSAYDNTEAKSRKAAARLPVFLHAMRGKEVLPAIEGLLSFHGETAIGVRKEALPGNTEPFPVSFPARSLPVGCP
jgi:hypothetical protein